MTAGQFQPDSCDADRIHLIGAVQPHGALLGADTSSGLIQHVSANIQEFLGIEPRSLLGGSVQTLLRDADWQRIQAVSEAQEKRRVLRPLEVSFGAAGDSVLECVPHQRGGMTYLEITHPAPPDPESWDEDELRRQIISDLVRPTTLDELADLSAEIVRKVNGFDRVMIYRFAEDDHGEVIAENTNRTDSYLGLHYPASDIPKPARRHFVLNVLRQIADVHATGVPILSDQPTQPADLSCAVLRAVPTTHLQYLKNMGVAASMSVSLVSNDRLWGLIACHNYTPRRVSLQVLKFTELIAGTISALLQGIENRMQLSRAIEAEQLAFAMEKQGRDGMPLSQVVKAWAPQMMTLLDAGGLVFRQSGDVSNYGATPSPGISYRPLRKRLTEGIAATDQLSEIADLDEGQIAVGAGAGYMELSGDGQDYLVLVRPQYEHTVKWAGKPETIAERHADGTTTLNPRASFALWTEERLGRSKPFDSTDLEALRIVRRALFALNSLEREAAAVQAREEAEAEEERLRLALLDAARKTSMGELASALAHELNQPLAAVSNYINACRAQLKKFGASLPAGFEDLMLDAVTEASRASDLVRRLRDFIAGGALQIEPSDLRIVVRQGVDLAMIASGASRPQLALQFDADLPQMWIDRIQIGQVVLNLAMNAITAMQNSERRLLEIGAELDDSVVLVTIKDTGSGIPPEMRSGLFEPFHSSTTSGMGIGLSLCRSIIEAHGGQIWAPETENGAVFKFTLPIESGERG